LGDLTIYPQDIYTPSQLQSPRLLDVLREGFTWANHIDIAIAFLRFSSFSIIENNIKEFIDGGGTIRVLASTYLGHSQPEALRILRELISIDNMRVFDGHFSGFEIKLLLSSSIRNEIWIGNSNTNLQRDFGTLSCDTNFNDKEYAKVAKNAFDILWNDKKTKQPTESFIDIFDEKLKSNINSINPDENNNKSKKIKPNEAQEEALQRLNSTRENFGTKALIVAAPGVGKTYLAAFDALSSGAKTILFLSHRLEHLHQAKTAFSKIFPNLRQTLCDGSNFGEDAEQVFATVQSAIKRKHILEKKWDYVVVDEFHHAEAPTYKLLIEKLSKRFLLGLTATPERADGHNVWKLCDNHIAYEVRLTDAINRGWLVPFNFFAVSDDVIDYQNIPWKSGGFDPNALENILCVQDRAELIIKHALVKGYDGSRRATVGFCAGRKHAKFMSMYFNKKGLISETVLGDDSIEKRIETYKRFADPNDPLEWLFVSDVLNEGVDIPAINSLLFLRPSDSSTVFIQQLGRGLRLHPKCQVLTVIDFVGHHRKAWLGIKALNDPAAMSCARSISIADITITPPRNCEIILDNKTREILVKVSKFRSKNQICKDAYEKLRSELQEPPFPQDLYSRKDLPTLKDFRDTFGSWLNCRIQMKDAEPWEEKLPSDHPLYQLLDRSEQDWQAPRIYPYASLWGAIADQENPATGYRKFFERFTQWKAEWKPEGETKVSQTMERKLGSLWANGCLIDSIFEIIPNNILLNQIEKRIGLVLQKDYKSRHGGVLRKPQDLELWKQYFRPEIINFFGLQYDPAVHNTGVISFSKSDPFPEDIIIITKIDTSTAHEQYHYINNFENDAITFRWQSQNSNNPKSGVGNRLVTPGMANLHLFVQPKSNTPAVYCGQVKPIRYESSNPIDVWFQLPSPIPLESFNALK
jgi:superfamily II DNA or RNA helicase/HKD family nuclease